MKVIQLVAAGLLLFVLVSVAPSKDIVVNKVISICRIEYSDAGKIANWHKTFFYNVVTNDGGLVQRIGKIGKDNGPSFIRENDLMNCVRNWKLAPQGKYVIAFSLGTTGEKYISIVEPDRNQLKLILE